jgi:hypothetical protein
MLSTNLMAKDVSMPSFFRDGDPYGLKLLRAI